MNTEEIHFPSVVCNDLSYDAKLFLLVLYSGLVHLCLVDQNVLYIQIGHVLSIGGRFVRPVIRGLGVFNRSVFQHVEYA